MSTSKRDAYWPAAINDYVANHHDTYPFIDPKQADLSGKSVLITGASRGIGLSASLSFASAGCSRIAIAARSELAQTAGRVKAAAKEAGRPEPQVVILQLDVTSEESVAAAAKVVDEAFDGSLDYLINNAGFLEEWKKIGDSDPAEWWKTWEINIKGIYLCSRYFIPLVMKSSMKTILNITSIAAHLLNAGASGYMGSKFAACRFTEHLDSEYGDEGLVAIAVHPGGVVTDLALGMPKHMHPLLADTAELPADTLVWLCRERRDWLAGRYMTVCWDMEELSRKKDEIVQGDLFKFRMTVSL